MVLEKDHLFLMMKKKEVLARRRRRLIVSNAIPSTMGKSKAYSRARDGLKKMYG